MSRELVPIEGREVVPATGTDLAIVGAGTTEAVPELESPRERDPKRMTPEEARRYVNRQRRVSFYLWVQVIVYETPWKDNFHGWNSIHMVPITASDLMDLLKKLGADKHANHYVRVSTAGQAGRHILVSVG